VTFNDEFYTGLPEVDAGVFALVPGDDPLGLNRPRSVYIPMGNLGGDIWEWLHADTVRREYEAVGKVPPTIEEIESGAYEDAQRAAGEAIKQAAGIGFGTLLLVGAVVLLVAVRK